MEARGLRGSRGPPRRRSRARLWGGRGGSVDKAPSVARVVAGWSEVARGVLQALLERLRCGMRTEHTADDDQRDGGRDVRGRHRGSAVAGRDAEAAVPRPVSVTW